MKIDHIALWVEDLECMTQFYTRYFDGTAGELYINPAKQFTSCFVTFGEGCRLELMHRPDITYKAEHFPLLGITHWAMSVGSRNAVDQLTEQLRTDGYNIISEPRTTGDGCYESVVADPEGNWVEITE